MDGAGWAWHCSYLSESCWIPSNQLTLHQPATQRRPSDRLATAAAMDTHKRKKTREQSGHSKWMEKFPAYSCIPLANCPPQIPALACDLRETA
ncbi:hypothetical protein SRHO_G00045080 [Serrasalmus rhombeus]